MVDEQIKLMTRAEVAELLGLTQTTLSRWATSGRGPDWFRVGRWVRYRTEEVARWVDQQEANAREGRS